MDPIDMIKEDPECSEFEMEPYTLVNQVTEDECNGLTSRGETLNDIEVKVENDAYVKEQARQERLPVVMPACLCSHRTTSSGNQRSVENNFEIPSKKVKVAEKCNCSQDRMQCENRSVDGASTKVTEIRVENNLEDENSNEREDYWEEVKPEPYELVAQNGGLEPSHPSTKEEPNPIDAPTPEDGNVDETMIKVEIEVDGNSNAGTIWVKPSISQGAESTVECDYMQNLVVNKYPEERKSIVVQQSIPECPCLPSMKPTSNLARTNAELPCAKHGQRSVEGYPSMENYGYEELTEQLYAYHLTMSHPGACKVSSKLLRGLLEWFFSKSEEGKLLAYLLRLEVAERARILGVAGFTPGDAWFINLKNQLPKDFFVDHLQTFSNYDKAIARSADAEAFGSLNKQRTTLFRNLAEWYHRHSSTVMVLPGQLEREAYRMAEGMGLGKFYLSKNDVLMFVAEQGLYCDVNGKISRFTRVKDGLLRLLFDAKFEVWYYEWHKSTEDLLQDTIRETHGFKGWSMFKAYLAILSQMIADGAHLYSLEGDKFCHSEAISLADTENLVSRSVFGPKRSLYDEALMLFCSKLQDEISKIKSFQSAFGKRYCYRSYTFCCDHLKKNAEELALSMGLCLSDIVIRKNWLRRFAELTVVCSLTNDAQHSHPKDMASYFPSTVEDFNSAFERWYEHGCPKDVAPYSSVAAGTMEPYDPSSKPCLDKANARSTHLQEVEKWYKEHSLRWFVKSYELKEKAEEIAYFMGMPMHVYASKSWMKSFLCRNGLKYYNIRDGLITVSNSTHGQAFVKLFETWYIDGNCIKCSKRVNYLTYSNRILKTEVPNVKSPTLDSAFHDWYVGAHGLVFPGALEKKAAQINRQLPNKVFTLSKKWVDDFIEQYGLYCVINGDRHLFFKSSFEFIRCTFLCEFEIWYYQWPLTSKYSLLSETVKNTNFETYKQSLLDWYLKVSQSGKIPSQNIETKSTVIINSIPGITPQDVEVWTKRLCRQYNDVVRKVRGFDYAMRIWYFERKKSGFCPYQELITEAEKCAKKLKLTNFVANDVWSKRFVERYGIYSFSEGVPKFLSSEEILWYDTDKLFRAWCTCDPTHGPKETALLEPETEPLVEPDVDPKPSSKIPPQNHLPEKLNTYELMDVDDSLHSSEFSAFETDISVWYGKDGNQSGVPPGLYLVKVFSLFQSQPDAAYSGLLDGAQRKYCIKKLVELHGLRVSSPWFHRNVLVFPAECSILKSRFELAFEIWYHGFPLRVDDVKPGMHLSSSGMDLIKVYLTALYSWYLNMVQSLARRKLVPKEIIGKQGPFACRPSPEDIRTKEAELIGRLTVQEEKRALITTWCRCWCVESMAWIDKIRKFDSELSSWYNGSRNYITPVELAWKAAETARMLGINGFHLKNAAWMRRFVQLHGLRYMHKGVKITNFEGFAEGSITSEWPSFSKFYYEWLETD